MEQVKQSRWQTRDVFLQMSQEPFAGANGIGPDHLQNFLDLQDAIIAKTLIQLLESNPDNQHKDQKRHIYGLLQLIFTESPKLIEFHFATPTTISRNTMKFLIDNCPALFALIQILKDYKTRADNKGLLYYWSTLALLAKRYPIQATLDLCFEIYAEYLNYRAESHKDRDFIFDILNDIRDVYPFIFK